MAGTVRFGQRDEFAIELDDLGLQGAWSVPGDPSVVAAAPRPRWGCCRLWLAGQAFGNPQARIRVRDLAEIVHESQCYVPALIDRELFAMPAADAVEFIWNRVNDEESPRRSLPSECRRIDELEHIDGFVWLEGIETFDGWRTVMVASGDRDEDDLRLLVAERGGLERHRSAVDGCCEHVLSIGRYRAVVQALIDWTRSIAGERVREPLWARRRRRHEERRRRREEAERNRREKYAFREEQRRASRRLEHK